MRLKSCALGVTRRFVQNRTLIGVLGLTFYKRAFAQRNKSNGYSWEFVFQNPLSESSSKASGI
jgi:hypothetical protein